MTTLKNVQPLSAEKLFDLLKTEFASYIDSKLNTNLSVEFAHVYNVINISFPEIIEGTMFTLIVNDDEIVLSNNSPNTEYNTELLEQHLSEFLNEKCS
ncbi:hypothetical protein IM792_21045 [Mucilaginibacter sp. JRF]|uniref:hypothetical protein n=1 Tax=Mucilaginibacter sp. JRF TaxID=2780088 RepID=UPI001882EAE0|nr:hypothetical protein [Mucilaginibacter sp. JRF]MBE9586948.1 hypothetical protein [Mucilaginibacter sp. JRF]